MSIATITRKLYRGETNNGVQTVLTPEAHLMATEAARLRRDRVDLSSQECCDVLRYVIEGTFAFAPIEGYSRPEVRTQVAGSELDLVDWTEGSPLIPSSITNHVPFSGSQHDGYPAPCYFRTATDVITAFGFVQQPRVQLFFRGSDNNGIFTLLTTQANAAAERIAKLRRDGRFSRSNYEHRLLQANTMAGTFAFAATSLYGDPAVRTQVVGSVEEMDRWTEGSWNHVNKSSVGNHVPFSSGPQKGHPAHRYHRTAADVITAFGFVQQPTN